MSAGFGIQPADPQLGRTCGRRGRTRTLVGQHRCLKSACLPSSITSAKKCPGRVEPSRPYGHCGLNAASIPTRVPGQKWWSRQEFNLRLPEFQSGALATELRDQERKGSRTPRPALTSTTGSSQVPAPLQASPSKRGRKGNRTLQAEQHRHTGRLASQSALSLEVSGRGSNPHAPCRHQLLRLARLPGFRHPDKNRSTMSRTRNDEAPPGLGQEG